MQGTIRDLLVFKNSNLVTVQSDITIASVIQLMNQRGVGSVLVFDGGDLVGIFTERDVLKRVAGAGVSAEEPVAQVMTSRPITVSSGTPIAVAMRMMSERRFRHLPVMDHLRVVGIVSAGDIMRHAVHTLEQEVENLHSYIQTGSMVPGSA